MITLLFFIVFGELIITILFGLAGISKVHISQIYAVFLGYAGALALAGSQAICMNVLFTFKKYRSIGVFSVAILILNLVLNFMVIKFFKNIQFISINTSIIQVISIIILLVLIFRHIKYNLSSSYN